MYQCGESVLYAAHGICTVITTEKRVLNRKRVEYYVLEPVDQPGARFYVPIQNPAAVAKIKTILSRQELLELLASPELRRDVWIEEENRRKQYYRELIAGGDRSSVLCMVNSILQQRRSLQESGRRLHLCDENFLRDACKMLGSEFSMVLDVPSESLKEYLQSVFCE